MKSLLRWRVLLPSVVVMAIATSVTLAVTIFAAAPPLPYEFFGTVKIDGQVPPDGTLVEALVSGVTPNAGSTTTFNGGPGLEGVYILPAKGDDPETSGVKEGGVQGDSISFRITPPGGSPLTANETATYGAAGGSETLNLTATSTGPTQHTLTVIKSGTGTGLVSSDNPHINCGTACTADYTQGTVVTLQATADQGSTFDGWSGGGGCSGTSTCAVTMNAPNTVTADFNTAVTQQHTLTVTKSGDGTGRVASSPAGIDCGPSCTADFPQDTVVTLTATPDAGSVFDRWDLCTGTTGPCNVFMGSPQTVKAFFKL